MVETDSTFDIFTDKLYREYDSFTLQKNSSSAALSLTNSSLLSANVGLLYTKRDENSNTKRRAS